MEETRYYEEGDRFIEHSDEDSDVRYINGSPIFYTTGQVAEIMGENDSTIRYWCDEFQEFLKIRKTGRNRMFTKLDIEKLKYIRELLRVQNLSIRQVKEYLSTPEAAALQPIKMEKEKVFMTALAQVLSTELDQRFSLLEDRIISYIEHKLDTMIQQQSNIETVISNSHKELVEEVKKEIQNEFQNIGNQSQKILTDMEKQILEREERLNKYIAEKFRQLEPQQEKKGFFQRLFGK